MWVLDENFSGLVKKGLKTKLNPLPMVEFSQRGSFEASYHAKQVGENGFPDAKFEFVQHVNNQNEKKVKSCLAQSLRKRILKTTK